MAQEPKPRRYDPRETIHTAIITAFTIAAALVWKDVIDAAIDRFIPAPEALLFKLLAALLATLAVIIAILLVLKTEEEVDDLIDELDDVTQRFSSYRRKDAAVVTGAAATSMQNGNNVSDASHSS